MKKFKRLIALVTVAMFILSFAAPVMASATAEQNAFARLNALGVAFGNDKGDPMLDKTYTRAEAAALMVQASGMGAAINSAKGATKFKDVPANHWATGVINLAVGAGVIQGYPDGTYKPDKEVTYAEMCAMLIGVLNYGSRLQGVWPTNVIGKAAQLGLLDGLTVADYNAAAVRGQVFKATDNSMDVKPLKQTKDGFEEEAKSLMELRLNVTKKAEGTVIGVPNYGTDKNKVTIDPTPGAAAPNDTDHFTVTVAAGVDPNANYGEKVVAWMKDDKAFFFEVKTDAASIIKDKLDGAYNAGTDEVKLDAKDKSYGFATGAVVKRNFATVAKTALLSGDKVKVVLDANGKIAYIEAWSYAQALVDEVKVADEKIVFSTPAGSLVLKDDVYSIIKNGKAIGLADVKAGDVLDYVANAGGTITNVFVSDAVKTGKLTAATEQTSAYTLTVGSEGVKTLTKAGTMLSDDNGDTFTAVAAVADFKPYFNKDVTVKLNKDGKAVYVISDGTSDTNEFPIFVRQVLNDSGLDTNTYFKAGKFDGTNVNYQVTKDTDINSEDVSEAQLANQRVMAADGAPEIVANDIVKISLTSDGKVDVIKTQTVLTDADGTLAVSKDNDTIAINGTAYKVTADTKIIKRKANGEVANLTWTGVESLVNGSGNVVVTAGNFKALTDAGKVTFAVILDDVTTTTDFKYGMIASQGTNAELGTFTEVDINGTYTKYKNSAGQADRTLIKFKVDADNKINNVSVVAVDTVSGATYNTYVVKSVNKTEKMLTVVEWDGIAEMTTKYYPIFDSKANLYSVKDSKLTDMTIDDLAAGDQIKLYDDLNADGEAGQPDGAYDFIVVVD